VTRRRVLWTRSARRDLEAIASYLADRSPEAAFATLDRLERRAASLMTLADRGRVVPELGRLHVRLYRELVVAPYRLIYRIRERQVLIVAAFDARRSLEDVILQRLLVTEDEP
jgi:toxin ParE1/3/4